MFDAKTRSMLELDKHRSVPQPVTPTVTSQPDPIPMATPARKGRAGWLTVPCVMLGVFGVISIAMTQLSDHPSAATTEVAKIDPPNVEAKPKTPIITRTDPTEKPQITKVDPLPVVPPTSPKVVVPPAVKEDEAPKIEPPKVKRVPVVIEEPNEDPPKVTIYENLDRAKAMGRSVDKPVLEWAGNILKGPMGDLARKAVDAIGELAIHVATEEGESEVRLIVGDRVKWFVKGAKFNDSTADKMIKSLPERYISTKAKMQTVQNDDNPWPSEESYRRQFGICMPSRIVRYQQGMELTGGELLTFDWSKHVVSHAYENGNNPPTHFAVYIGLNKEGGTLSFKPPRVDKKLYTKFESAKALEVERRAGTKWPYSGTGEVISVGPNCDGCELEGGVLLIRCGAGCCGVWERIKKSDSLAE